MALRELLKRSSLLVNVVRSARIFGHKVREIIVGSVRTNYEIVNELAAFSPNWSPVGAFRAEGALTLESAQQTFPLICSLVEAASKSLIAPQPIETLFPTQKSGNEAAELAALFNQYGSDKSTAHDYHLVYAPLLGSRRSDPLRMLEIGVGTKKPGASLRAFRDFCPKGLVFGADIDRSILFDEDRIRTYYVDQTRSSSFDELYSNLANNMFDLVIDDGLHTPNANIATMIFALKILRPFGIFIAEDIKLSSLPIWQVVAALLPENFNPKIIQAKGGLLFMIKKPI
jgi:hypothetical protein